MVAGYPMRSVLIIMLFSVSCFHPIWSMWVSPSVLSKMSSEILNFVVVSDSKSMKGVVLMKGGLMLLLLGVTMLGNIPYITKLSIQLFFSPAFCVTLWLGVVFSSIAYSFNKYILGMIVTSVSGFMVAPLVVMELLSGSMRIVTLSLRYIAAMSMGGLLHYIAGCTGTLIFNYEIFCILNFGGCWHIFLQLALNLLPFLLCMVILVFELMMSALQVYIIWLLLKVFLDEHS